MACTDNEFREMEQIVHRLAELDVYTDIDLAHATNLWLEENAELTVAIMHRLRDREVADDELYAELIDVLWSLTSLCRLLRPTPG